MVIDVRQIIAGNLMDRDPIDKPRINVAMTIVQTMSGVRGPTEKTISHHDRTRDSKLGRSRPYPRKQTAPTRGKRSETSAHRFVCQQPGHYTTQCAHHKGKELAVNTIKAEVQHLTMRQQAKSVHWAAQDEVRKAAQVWVEKANAANIERMRQESANNSLPMEEDTLSLDPIWRALENCELTMTTWQTPVLSGPSGESENEELLSEAIALTSLR